MIRTQNLTITTITDNSTAVPGILAEWGLSILIETEKDTILLDTGTTDVVTKNADTLNLNLRAVDAVVLSHGHYDHTGGLPAVLDRIGRSDIRVVAHPEIMESKYSYKKTSGTYKYVGIPYRLDQLVGAGARFEFTKEPVWLSDDFVTSGEEPMRTAYESVSDTLCIKEGGAFVHDPMNDDQSLYIRTEKGLIVILGCAHRGMINCIEHGRELTGTDKVFMVIGGTHLGPASTDQYEKTVTDLKDMGVTWLGVSHCTGLPVAAKLASEFKDRFFFNTAGSVIRFPFDGTLT